MLTLIFVHFPGAHYQSILVELVNKKHNQVPAGICSSPCRIYILVADHLASFTKFKIRVIAEYFFYFEVIDKVLAPKFFLNPFRDNDIPNDHAIPTKGLVSIQRAFSRIASRKRELLCVVYTASTSHSGRNSVTQIGPCGMSHTFFQHGAHGKSRMILTPRS